MARVRLQKDEVEAGGLPPLCMKCGAPAATTVSKTFSWHPPWVPILLLAGLLPYIIVAVITTQRMHVAAPMCPSHRSHWTWRSLAPLLGLLLLLAVGGGGFALLVNQPGQEELGGYFCMATIVGLLLWVVGTVVLHYTSIRPTEITGRSITLTGVSPQSL